MAFITGVDFDLPTPLSWDSCLEKVIYGPDLFGQLKWPCVTERYSLFLPSRIKASSVFWRISEVKHAPLIP